MKLIVDIPDDMFNRIQDDVYSTYDGVDSLKAVRNGTSLPKGHGRLIDADEIQFENTEFETYGDYCIAFDAIDNAPTIIEADREGASE